MSNVQTEGELSGLEKDGRGFNCPGWQKMTGGDLSGRGF